MKNHSIIISFNSGSFATNDEKQYYLYDLHDYVCRTILFWWNFLLHFRTFYLSRYPNEKGLEVLNRMISAVSRNHSGWKLFTQKTDSFATYVARNAVLLQINIVHIHIYPNPTSELLHHVTFSRNPNLKVQKALFCTIFGVELYRLLTFFLNFVTVAESTIFTLQHFFWIFQISFFSWRYRSMKLIEYFAVFVNTILPKKFRPESRRDKALYVFWVIKSRTILRIALSPQVF